MGEVLGLALGDLEGLDVGCGEGERMREGTQHRKTNRTN